MHLHALLLAARLGRLGPLILNDVGTRDRLNTTSDVGFNQVVERGVGRERVTELDQGAEEAGECVRALWERTRGMGEIDQP